MVHQCQHQWTECTHVMRELLGPSEFGGWEVNERAYFVCANCLAIETRPAHVPAVIRAPLVPTGETTHPERWPAVA